MSFINFESQAGGSVATCRVFQVGQVKRVGTRRREMPRNRELQYIYAPMPAAATPLAAWSASK
jgi:hypothetical protein